MPSTVFGLLAQSLKSQSWVWSHSFQGANNIYKPNTPERVAPEAISLYCQSDDSKCYSCRHVHRNPHLDEKNE